MVELEFSLEQDLQYEDAVESMFDLLDFFQDSDSFDEIEWDEEEDTAFLANDDLEVEIVLNDGSIDVYAKIFAPDLTRNEMRRNLEEDISNYFGLERSRRSSRRGARRDWRENRSFQRTAEERDEEESSRVRKQSSGRFGRLRPNAEESKEESREREPRAKRGGARRLRRREEAEESETTAREKSAPKPLPSGKQEEEKAVASKPATPVTEKKAESKAKAAPAEVETEEESHAVEEKKSEAKEKLAAKSAEKKELDKKPQAVARPEPQAPAEAKSSGGFWWFVILLILVGGLVALYFSPLWPLAK